MPTDKMVLVTGATGRQGGAVIRHMLPNGWKLRALTRSPGSYAAKELARQGVEVVQGDLEDLSSLDRAARGVYGIYSVQDFWAVGAKREVQQGKNLARLLRKRECNTLFTAPRVGLSGTAASPTLKASGRLKSTFANSACLPRSFGRLLSWRPTTFSKSKWES